MSHHSCFFSFLKSFCLFISSLASTCHSFHLNKRLNETMFVHQISHGTMLLGSIREANCFCVLQPLSSQLGCVHDLGRVPASRWPPSPPSPTVLCFIIISTPSPSNLAVPIPEFVSPSVLSSAVPFGGHCRCTVLLRRGSDKYIHAILGLCLILVCCSGTFFN